MTDDHPYKCIRCRASPLAPAAGGLRCPGCGADYPVALGVPLLLRDVRVSPSGVTVSEETAVAIARWHEFPEDPGRLAAARRVFEHDYHLPDLSLAAENNYFLSRMPLPDKGSRGRVTDNAAGLPVNRDVRYRVAGHLIPDAVRAGEVSSRNVRLENTGGSVISSRGAGPVNLSYRWRAPTGRVVVADGERTPLPIDLHPGRAITLPAAVRAPADPGPYMLELTLVREGVAWLDRDSFHVGVDVVPAGGPAVPGHWQVTGPNPDYEYYADHDLAAARLAEEFARRRRPETRALELGGGCDPMTRGMADAVYCADIDVQTLQIGAAFAGPGERTHFVAADAHDLPFAPGSFDAVVTVSALHHFADPHRVLAGLKPLLRPGGFLAVLCEPVGSYHGRVSEEFVNELENGINEQIFTQEEYHRMFQRAGLYAPWVAVDGGSFKAILQADPPE